MGKIATVCCLALLCFLAGSGLVYGQAQAQAQGSSDSNLTQLVRDIIRHELDMQAKDQALWCFRKMEEKSGKPQQLFVACQSKGGEIDRLIAVNGHPLDEKQQRAEDLRVQMLVKNPAQLRKQTQQEHQDAQQAERLLRMIPEAFVFTNESADDRLLKLKFKPNSKFRPSGYEAQVFHHMEGTLTLNTKQRRLAEIDGRLMDTVKFGGGLLGHLDKGGTFLVKQEEVAPQVWEVTTMDVKMDGKALFFKTIAVREKEINSDFRLVPQGTTIQQAAALTKDALGKDENAEMAAKK
ncbi:MAG TPA: hypothetical protein VFF42_03620 [Candidatus Eremiobacteraceae bacterium]|nr:hypothetical protein [Candidatus Eremiobacteraceae bacterium]